MFAYKKCFLGTLSIFFIAIILGNLILYFFESSFIFKPLKYPQGNWHPTELNPKDVWLTSADGTRIHGWYLGYSQPKNIILYLHGNKGNVTDRYSELLQLHDKLCASVMSIDYRGFGKSEGEPSEQGMVQDAEAASLWLANKEKVTSDKLILLGRSMGGGVAIDLGSRLKIKGLILISTFLSLPDTVEYHYPFLAAHSLMHNQFDSLHKIALYSGPLLIIHGDEDEIIPFKQGMQLFSLAKGRKLFIRIPKGHHFDPIPGEVYPQIDNFYSALNSLQL